MKTGKIAVLALLAILGSAPLVSAADFAIAPGDTIQKILEERKGKRVTLRLQGNDELTGKVRAVTGNLVQLGELSGRDFFDAVVELGKVSAVIIRIKE